MRKEEFEDTTLCLVNLGREYLTRNERGEELNEAALIRYLRQLLEVR
jgi:hypothetical protein